MPLFITEYSNLARDVGSNFIAAGMEPAIADHSMALAGSSTQSPLFNAGTAFIMIHAQEACNIAWGENPTAATTKQRLAAGETRFVGVPPGKNFRLAACLGV